MAWENNSFQKFHHNPAYQSLHQQMSSSTDSRVDTAGFVQHNLPGCRPSPTAMLTSAAAAAAAFEFIAPVSSACLISLLISSLEEQWFAHLLCLIQLDPDFSPYPQTAQGSHEIAPMPKLVK
jgi:hypothetical protein